MFYKFASNILRDVVNECELKSFSVKDEDLRKIYCKIAEKLNWVIEKLGVENPSVDN
jgi:hypothetical protein